MRIGFLVEWACAVAGVLVVVLLVLVPLQRALGPGLEATPSASTAVPPGVPAGAMSVPLVMLLDGREIRQGELHARVQQLIPELAAAPIVARSTGRYGERVTRRITVGESTFFVVCEPIEDAGPVKVSGLYLP